MIQLKLMKTKNMNRFVVLIIVFFFVVMPIKAQTLTETEVTAIMNSAFELHNSKRYSEALEAFLTVGKNTEQQRYEDERRVYVCSQTMACSCYYMTEQYDECYILAKKLIAGKLDDSEKRDVCRQYVLSGYMVAAKLKRAGQYAQARELLQNLIPYADEQLKKYVLPAISLNWYFEGFECQVNEDYEQAMKCYKAALKGFSELGRKSDEISVLKQIALINTYWGKTDKSISTYEQAFVLSRNIGNEVGQMEVANELRILNTAIGDMEQKIYYTDLMDSLFKATTNIDVHCIYYRAKGKELKKQRKYKQAELYFRKAMNVAVLQKENISKGNILLIYHDLGSMYHIMGRYDEAYDYLQLSLGENREITIENYLTHILIADIYLKKGNKDNCIKYLDDLFELESYIHEPIQLSKLYATRGNYYVATKDYQLALQDYRKADEIMATKYSVLDAERSGLYPMLGGIEYKLDNYKQAEYYYELYAKAMKHIYGENSFEYIDAQIYLANAQGFAGNIKDGCDNYTSATAKLKETIKNRLPYMNAVERESFWNSLSSLFTDMTPYALKAEQYQTKYTKTCYNALLLSKAFLLDTERSLYDIIRKGGSDNDMNIYMTIATINSKIKEWENDFDKYADSIFLAFNEVEQLETKLIKQCETLEFMTSFVDVDYAAVKNVLKQNEVLIDFTDFTTQEGERRYAAYIVDKNQKYPLLESLFAESQIDSLGIVRPDMYYDKYFAEDIIKLLWNPIKGKIKEKATVYYVPSQLLFQISLESLPLNDGTLLGEHYDFVRLSSARELVKKRTNDSTKPTKETSAVLYGGLQYDLEPELMALNARQYNLSSLLVMRDADARGDSIFKELSGAKMEVEKISETLKQSNFDVCLYIGERGTEESFMNMHGQSPRILHLATHGFYYTPSEAKEVNYLKGYSDAMLLSGLIMAGGNAEWTGKKLPDGVLGGVLTANDIAQLDLSGTDMVVLSACQSGQGNVTAEGLYGLQRAFKKAGVGTIVMALWKISDQKSAEFMVEFYKSLVDKDWDKRKAFENAKLIIRGRYPNDPYYWAAFVMLD